MARLLETSATKEGDARRIGLAVEPAEEVVVAAVNVERLFGEDRRRRDRRAERSRVDAAAPANA